LSHYSLSPLDLVHLGQHSLSGLMEEEGFLNIYDAGIIRVISASYLCGHWCHDRLRSPSGESEDIPPRSSRPVRDFFNIGISTGLGFTKLEAVSIGIIGACDGPTAIYVTSKYALTS